MNMYTPLCFSQLDSWRQGGKLAGPRSRIGLQKLFTEFEEVDLISLFGKKGTKTIYMPFCSSVSQSGLTMAYARLSSKSTALIFSPFWMEKKKNLIYCDCLFHNLAQLAWQFYDGFLQTFQLEIAGAECLCIFDHLFQNPSSFVAFKTYNLLSQPLGLGMNSCFFFLLFFVLWCMA